MDLRGTNQEFGRPFNRRIVLETIRLRGPISRPEIARDVALSAQTVLTITRELEQAGLVTTAREEPKGRGQPATLLTVNPKGAHATGVQLTPTAVTGTVVDLAGHVLGRAQRQLGSTVPDVVFPVIGEVVAELAAVKPPGRHLGVGLVMPGPFGVEKMSFVGSTTMQGWADVPIVDRLEEIVGVPAFLGMDAAAAAMGERHYGAGRLLREFFLIYFGVGLGGGIIREGDVWRGAFGNASEFGHLPLDPNGEACPCGNRGCLETVVSLDALGRRLAAAGVDPARADLGRLAEERHPVVDNWVADAVSLLGRAIVAVENLIEPEAVVIGGLLPKQLLDLLLQVMELPPSVTERSDRVMPRVLRSQLGSDAALRGAASLALAGMLSPRFGLLFADDDEGYPLAASGDKFEDAI